MGTILGRRKLLDEVVTAQECRERFSDLIAEYQRLFDKQLSEEHSAFLQQDVRQLALHVNDRIGYWEQRRTFFLQAALGMLGFGLAGLGAVAVVSDRMLAHPLAFVAGATLATTALALVLASISLLWLWNAQNNPSYPFTKVASTWRWLYRYAEPEESQVQVWVEPPSKDQFYHTMQVYLENLIAYSKKTVALDRTSALEQDVGQLFLLIVNEKYKIKFVSMLRDRFWRCLKATLAGFGAGLLFSGLFVILGWYAYFFPIRN